jgi:DUF1016 N-terminal domain
MSYAASLMLLQENTDFMIFVEEIKTHVEATQYRALQVVNKEQIQLYWQIGKTIIGRQNQFGWTHNIITIKKP